MELVPFLTTKYLDLSVEVVSIQNKHVSVIAGADNDERGRKEQRSENATAGHGLTLQFVLETRRQILPRCAGLSESPFRHHDA